MRSVGVSLDGSSGCEMLDDATEVLVTMVNILVDITIDISDIAAVNVRLVKHRAGPRRCVDVLTDAF